MLTWMVLLACQPAPTETEPKRPGGQPTTLPTTSDQLPTVDLSLVLNEVVAANDSVWVAADGTTPDVVELWNTGDEPISLDTAELGDRAGHRIPLSGTVEPGGAWVVEIPPDPKGLGLDRDGDDVLLYVDGMLADRVSWDEMGADTSLARFPTAEGEWLATGAPSLGEDNPMPSASLDPADATVFVADRVHDVVLTVAKEDWDLLAEGGGLLGLNHNYKEVDATLVIDGVPYPTVGLRRKGSASSAPLSGQPPFKVDLDHADPGARFRTLKAFNLHNGKVLDPTKVRDHITFTLARDLGLMAPRIGWAKVTLNGTYYGLYILVESHDDTMMERFRGPDPVGLLYEPNASEDGGIFNFSDWGGPIDWDLEEDAEPDERPALLATLDQVNDLLGGPPSEAAAAELWSVMNQDLALSYLAWEAVSGHTDGYYAPNNWRVYVDGLTQQVEMVPSGAEWTWDQPIAPWSWRSTLGSWCLDVPSCRVAYAEKLLEVADRVDELDLVGEFDRVSSGLDALIKGDPRSVHSNNVIDRTRTSTKDNLVGFPQAIRETVCRDEPQLCP